MAVFVDVSVIHDVRVPVPVRVLVLEAVADIVGRIPVGVPSAKMLKRIPSRSILAYHADRQKVFKRDRMDKSIAWVTEWLRWTTQDRLEYSAWVRIPSHALLCGWPSGEGGGLKILWRNPSWVRSPPHTIAFVAQW